MRSSSTHENYLEVSIDSCEWVLTMTHEILIEGYTPEEILSYSDHEMADLIFFDQPVVFRVGSATILGEFSQTPRRLTLELAQIDGGGEGVLPAIWTLAEKYARQRGIAEIEWIVHAINCAKPNLKLRRLLGKMGFTIQDTSKGEAYYLRVTLQ